MCGGALPPKGRQRRNTAAFPIRGKIASGRVVRQSPASCRRGLPRRDLANAGSNEGAWAVCNGGPWSRA